MKPTEAAELCRYIEACCPSQKLDQFTSRVWESVLGDLPLPIAKLAVDLVARTRPYVAACDIWQVGTRMRTYARRAVRAAMREAGELGNVDAAADQAIAAGAIDFTGIDLMSSEAPEQLWYSPRVPTIANAAKQIERNHP